MAVGVTMTIPVVILVLFSQKSIVRGLTGGAINKRLKAAQLRHRVPDPRLKEEKAITDDS